MEERKQRKRSLDRKEGKLEKRSEINEKRIWERSLERGKRVMMKGEWKYKTRKNKKKIMEQAKGGGGGGILRQKS